MDAINLLWSARLRSTHCLCQTPCRSLPSVKKTSSGKKGGGDICLFLLSFVLVGGCFVGFFFIWVFWFFLNSFSTLSNSLPWVSYLPLIVMNQLMSTRQCAISYSESSVDCDQFPKSKFLSSSTQKMLAFESRTDQTLEALQKLWDRSDSNSDFKVHFHYLS